MSKILRIDKINNQILQGAKAVFFQQKEIQNRAFFSSFQPLYSMPFISLFC